MKNLNRIIGLGFMAVAIVGTLLANVIINSLSASSIGSDIEVSWKSVDETGVQRYEVLRRAGDTGDFLVIGIVDQLKGNNSPYEFTDKSVFKTTSGYFQYKIRIINGQNPSPETEIVGVSHLSSAAKRTWGSIKAMFR
jgi:hypothetical protein